MLIEDIEILRMIFKEMSSSMSVFSCGMGSNAIRVTYATVVNEWLNQEVKKLLRQIHPTETDEIEFKDTEVLKSEIKSKITDEINSENEALRIKNMEKSEEKKKSSSENEVLKRQIAKLEDDCRILRAESSVLRNKVMTLEIFEGGVILFIVLFIVVFAMLLLSYFLCTSLARAFFNNI